MSKAPAVGGVTFIEPTFPAPKPPSTNSKALQPDAKARSTVVGLQPEAKTRSTVGLQPEAKTKSSGNIVNSGAAAAGQPTDDKPKPNEALQSAFGKAKSVSSVGKKLTKSTSEVTSSSSAPPPGGKRSVGGKDVDTLRSYAARYGVTVDAVREANPALRTLLPDDSIPPGTKMTIPKSSSARGRRSSSLGGYVDEQDDSSELLNPVSSKEAQLKALCEILTDSEFTYRGRLRDEWQATSDVMLKDCMAFTVIVKGMLSSLAKVKHDEKSRRDAIRREEADIFPSFYTDYDEGVEQILAAVFNACRTSESIQRRGIIEAQFKAWDELQSNFPEAFAMAEQASWIGREQRARRVIVEAQWREAILLRSTNAIIGDEVTSRVAHMSDESQLFLGYVAEEAIARLEGLRRQEAGALLRKVQRDAEARREQDMLQLLAEQRVERADFEDDNLRERLAIERQWLTLALEYQFQCFIVDAETLHRHLDVAAVEEDVRAALKRLEQEEVLAAIELTKIRNLERYMALLAAIDGFEATETAARLDRIIDHERRAFKLLCGVEYRDRVLAQAAYESRVAREEAERNQKALHRAADRERLQRELADRVERQREAEREAMLVRHEAQRDKLARHETKMRERFLEEVYAPTVQELHRTLSAHRQYAKTVEAARHFAEGRAALDALETADRNAIVDSWSSASGKFFVDLNRQYASAKYRAKWGHLEQLDEDAEDRELDLVTIARVEELKRRKIVASFSTGFRALMDALEVEERMIDNSAWRVSTHFIARERAERDALADEELMVRQEMIASGVPMAMLYAPPQKLIRTPKPPGTAPSSSSPPSRPGSRSAFSTPRPPPSPPPHCTPLPTATGAMIRHRCMEPYDDTLEVGSTTHLYQIQTRFDDVVRTRGVPPAAHSQ